MSNGAKVISSIADVQAVAAYLRRVGGRARSFRSAVVETQDGKYLRVIGSIEFSSNGTVEVSSAALAPTESEAALIAEGIAQVTFPTHTPVAALHNLPPELEDADKDTIFVFRDDRHQIVMLQQRVEFVEGKSYIPWTFWSDGVWRRMEPDSKLPIWGMEQIDEHSIVVIHEGAKAARAVCQQIDGQKPPTIPWLPELRNAAHLGWIGGAPNPWRTDWQSLRRKGIKRAYIVSDNDAMGRAAVPRISRELNCPTFHVQFNEAWPEGFDLADSFPKDMFRSIDRETVYVGPDFASCLHPATWATDEIVIPPEGRGQPRRVHQLRPAFASQWAWVEGVDLFVAIEFASVLLKKDVFNAACSPFSHVKDTAALLQRHYTGRKVSLTYRPDMTERFITDDGVSAINLFRPTLVKPIPGDCEPFHDFMDYLFPIEDERDHMKRWFATLVARPDIRMAHGCLCVSEVQGIGKTTLGNIAAELVGKHNASFPGEAMIVKQDFNGWLSNKRLIVVNEIYSGHSWQAYHRLKSYITDDYIEVNIKHMATFTIPNWTHYFVCSNSLNALKVEDKDRRWFVPMCQENPRPLEYFIKLRAWLAGGGYGRILAWAQSYGDYLSPGQIAPMTKSKMLLIEDSRSDGEKMAFELAEIIVNMKDKAVAVPLTWVKEWVRERLGQAYDNERRLGRVMRVAGLCVSDEQISVKGKRHRLATNTPALLEATEDRSERLAAVLKHPKDILQEPF